jgi:membrane-associated phospholipid phosphatase
LLPLPFLVVGRLNLPLQDPALAAFDHMVGFSTPAVMAWASHSSIGAALNFSYMLLQPFMVLALLVPALAGKAEAKILLLANLVGLIVAGGLFMFLPAVGPWYPHKWVADALQLECENDLMRLRAPAVYLYSFSIQEAGIVCFPSCHVFWSVLSASAFWGFRWLRIPAALLCAMIVLSTLTTGWHYLADVLAGLALSAASIAAARRLAR